MTDAAVGPTVSARRRIHVGAVIVYAALLYVFSPMNLVVIGWFADFEDAISHRVHEVSIGTLFTLGFLGVVGQLRRSDRTTAAVQAVVALAVAAAVVTTTTGFEPLVLAYLLPPLALAALDPEWRRTLLPPMARDSRLLVFAAFLFAILGPDVIANFTKARLQVQDHVSHWGAMAAFAIAVCLLALLAAFRPPGWRLAAWSTVGAVTLSAAVSLAFRYDASALGVSHSLTLLLWAAGFAAAVSLVGTRHPERLPVRIRGEGLVAGVASAIARARGWRVGVMRAAFAVPIIGSAAYVVLWLVLPVEGEATRRGHWRLVLGALAFAATILVVGGSLIFLIVGPLLLVAGVAVVLGPLIAALRNRIGVGRAFARIAARIATTVGITMLLMVWFGDDFGAPDVPHRVESFGFDYCASCHAVPGAAVGAPVWPDIMDHSDGELCVSCHSSLPPEPLPQAWWFPLEMTP